MKIGAIVQARLNSKRLPGKVLLPLSGKPVLWHVLNRLRHAKTLETIVLATSNSPEDRMLKEVADELNIPTFFGSLDDVLSRYYNAAKEYGIDPIVRITADCPLIDPEILDETIEKYISGSYDWYGLKGAFPDGLDIDIFSFKAISIAFNEAKLNSEREHVGVGFFARNSQRFKIGGYEKFHDKGHYRWTLDEPKDYEFLKIIYSRLYREGSVISYRDVFDLLEKEPSLLSMNSHIVRNEGYLRSLKEDEESLKGTKTAREK